MHTHIILRWKHMAGFFFVLFKISIIIFFKSQLHEEYLTHQLD